MNETCIHSEEGCNISQYSGQAGFDTLYAKPEGCVVHNHI